MPATIHHVTLSRMRERRDPLHLTKSQEQSGLIAAVCFVALIACGFVYFVFEAVRVLASFILTVL